MVDLAIEFYRRRHGQEKAIPSGLKDAHSAPSITNSRLELSQRREATISQLQACKAAAAPVVRIFEDPQVLKQMRQDKQFNMQFLVENFNVRTQSTMHISCLFWFSLIPKCWMLCLNMRKSSLRLAITLLRQIFSTITVYWYYG